MLEYKVLETTYNFVAYDNADPIEPKARLHAYLNLLAEKGWRVIASYGVENKGVIILERPKS